ncbi:MAG: amidohydrolase family protein [Opitutaceae bacterium]
MTRRKFLHHATAAAAASALARHSVAASARSDAIPAIDTHIHLYDPTRPQGVPWPPKSESILYQTYLPDRFTAAVAPSSVAGAVVVEASSWIEDNQWILDLARNHPVIVGVVGRLAPGKPEFAGHLRRFAADPLFRGIRIGGTAIKNVVAGAFVDDLLRLSDHDLALDINGNATMLRDIVELARLTPRLRIVINHLPHKEFDGDPAALRAAFAPVAALPNVYAKVSAVLRRVNDKVVDDSAYYRAGLDVIYELFGPRRLFYGSNWPVSERVGPYSTVHRVVSDYFTAKGRAVAENFFWRNSLAAYRWQPRGAAAALVP